MLMVYALLCKQARKWFSPPASLETRSSQRDILFYPGERPEKKRSNLVMAMKIMATPIKTCFEQYPLLPKGLLLFVFLPLKGKQIKQ
jgi:hypothetical protein